MRKPSRAGVPSPGMAPIRATALFSSSMKACAAAQASWSTYQSAACSASANASTLRRTFTRAVAGSGYVRPTQPRRRLQRRTRSAGIHVGNATGNLSLPHARMPWWRRQYAIRQRLDELGTFLRRQLHCIRQHGIESGWHGGHLLREAVSLKFSDSTSPPPRTSLIPCRGQLCNLIARVSWAQSTQDRRVVANMNPLTGTAPASAPAHS